MSRFLVCITFVSAVVWTNNGYAARIVSLNPGLTDILLSLNLANELVAVSDYCLLPGDFELPRVGTELAPNTEALLISKPSHIATGQSLLRKRLTIPPGTKHITLPLTKADEVRSAIVKLAQKFDRMPEASKLIDELDDSLRPRPKGFSKVLVVAGLSQHQTPQFYAMNPYSLHGDLLEAAGFALIKKSNSARSWIVGPENLVRLDPDLVIILDPSAKRISVRKQYEDALRPLRETDGDEDTKWIFLTEPGLSSMGTKAFGLGQAALQASASLKAIPK